MPEPNKPNFLRQLDRKYWIDTSGVIHTPSGSTIPADEPLFILRGRDELASELLHKYSKLADARHCGTVHLRQISITAAEFNKFAQDHRDRMHLPTSRGMSAQGE